MEQTLSPTELEFWMQVYVALIANPDVDAAAAADRAVVKLRRRMARGIDADE